MPRMMASASVADRAGPDPSGPPGSTGSEPRSDDEASFFGPGDGERRRRWALTAGALAAWALLIVAARLWGQHLIDELGREALRLSAPPLVGWDDLRLSARIVAPVAVAVAVVVWAPRFVRRLEWRRLLAVAAAATALWALSLAFTDGLDGVTAPTVLPGDEYLLDVDQVGSPTEFLSGFTDNVDSYSTHVRSHPPGALLTLWSMDRVGLGGQGWAAVLFIIGGALAVPSVLVAVREVVGEKQARAAAPFVVLAPAAVWIATTADALFAGVAAAGVAFLVVATGREGRRSDACSAAGGLLFGATLMLSYGLALIAVIPVAVAVARRRFRPLAVAVLATAGVLACFWMAGFSYVDGWSTSRGEYLESVASTRPFGYFVWANLAALAIVVGPASAAGLALLRDRRMWLLVGGALGAIALADLSGYSKGEVERIWLPFAIWILPAGAVLLERTSDRVLRGWLAAQAVVALLVQTGIRTRW